MTNTLGIQSRPPQLAELEEGQSVTVLLQPKTLGGGAPVAAQYREYKRVGSKLLSWVAKDMSNVDYAEVFPGTVTVSVIPAGEADYDKFLVSNGGVITYRTAEQMISDLGIATADHVHALSDLTDAVITGPADLDVLQYNGSNWVDRTLAEAGISAVGHLHDDRYYTETEIDAMPLVDYSGTPTAGHIPYFTAADTIAMDSGQFFWDAANNRLGVGTSSPQRGVHISGSGPGLRFSDTNAETDQSVTGTLEFYRGNATNRVAYLAMDSNSNNILALATDYTAGILQLRTGNAVAAMTVDASQNVGIGTSSPADKLHIVGTQTAHMSASLYVEHTGASAGTAYGAVIEKTGASQTNVGGLFSATGATNNYGLIVSAGYVGIGTAAPLTKLQVNKMGIANRGQLRLSTTATTWWELGRDNLGNFVIVDDGLGTVLTILQTSGYVGINEATPDKLLTLADEGDLGNKTFSSGWAGSGWNLDYVSSVYKVEIDDLFVRGSLTVYELIINQINAVNGAMIISPARGKVASVTGSPATEVVTMEDPEGNGYTTFAANDIVLIQRVDLNTAYTIVKRIVRKVASASGAAVTMSAAAGAPADTGSIAAGDVVVVIGNLNNTARDASIYITSTDSNNPYIQVMDGVTSWATWTDVNKIKCVIGNLNGKYGYASEIYGFAAGDKTNEYVTIDPTNGFRILDGDESDEVMLQASASTLSVGANFVYTTADTTLLVAGWTVDSTKILHAYDTDHFVKISTTTGAESIYFVDVSPDAGDVTFIGLGKLYNGAAWTADEGVGCVVYNGATYDKMFWLSQNEKSIAGWQITKGYFEKFVSSQGVRIDAANRKIIVGNLTGQRIEMDGVLGRLYFYNTSGTELLRLGENIFGDFDGLDLKAQDAILHSTKSFSSALNTHAIALNISNPGAGDAFAIHVTGGICDKVGGGEWAVASDIRVKKNITDYALGLDALLQLNPVSFKYNGLADGAPNDGRTYVGLVAQDAEKIIPSIVSAHKAKLDGKKVNNLRMMDGSELKYMTINATKELHARLVDLEGEVATLRTQLGLA